ncbi:MAG: 1-acyl-sn-glycerol-3-phosphate acyltransferase [Verrucomicrobiales bacterium]|nr:1-acyl-sn-glycerol-3-phosphate acyltransferase [Verrucomicrobiales bacterium]
MSMSMGGLMLRHPWVVLRFCAGYASYFLSTVIFVVAGIPLLVVLAPFPRRRHQVLRTVTHRFLAFFTRGWLPLLGIYRVTEIQGLEQAVSIGPSVWVANHRGFMDGLLLLGLAPGTGVVIKARDTKQPMYAMLARHFDLVSVDRNSVQSVAASVEKSRRLLAQGRRLLVFPEGTRARNGRLQRFNRLAFDLAVESGVPVVPILIHSTEPFMAKLPGSFFPVRPNRYRIRFLEPILMKPDENPGELSDRVYRDMAGHLRALDAGTTWENLGVEATRRISTGDRR